MGAPLLVLFAFLLKFLQTNVLVNGTQRLRSFNTGSGIGRKMDVV